MTGNLRLITMYANLRLQSGLVLQGIKNYDPERTRRAIKEHIEIIECICNGEAEIARLKIQDHLQDAMSTRLMMLITP